MKILVSVLGVLALAAILCILISLPVMWLWNGLMPAIFGLTTITWTQALGLSVLSNFLFKSSNSK